MSYTIKIIKKGSSGYPQVLQNKFVSTRYPRIWTIGNLDILGKKLLGFFCSVKCPGNVILKTYDLAREFRDAGIAVISGFHSPIEKDCLDLLLKGTQPVAICPARGIEKMRIPKAWQKSLSENRLLILSPFESKHRWPTIKLAEQRNKFVASFSDKIFVAHANEASQTERFCTEIYLDMKAQGMGTNFLKPLNQVKIGGKSAHVFDLNKCTQKLANVLAGIQR